jgi:phage terminase small subunit
LTKQQDTSKNFPKLTKKEKLFADEYLIDLNATQAYKRAKYKVKNDNVAGVFANRLLSKVKISAYIEEKRSKIQNELDIKQKDVLTELARIAFSNPKNYFTEANCLKEMSNLTDSEAAAIASIEVEELFDGKGEERTFIGYTRKIKFWNKVDALELLGKHLAMFNTRIILDDSEFEITIGKKKV